MSDKTDPLETARCLGYAILSMLIWVCFSLFKGFYNKQIVSWYILFLA